MAFKKVGSLFFVTLLVLALSLSGCSSPAPSQSSSSQPAGGAPAAAPPSQPASTPAPAKVDFPTKPIRIIVPYTAGGATDLSARMIADIITENKILSQPVIVVNIPGSNAAEGMKTAIEADPDGYTILFSQTISLQGLYLMGGLPYNVFQLHPFAQVLEVPTLLVASSEEPYDTVDELITYAKANPKKVIFMHAGPGSAPNFAMETLFKAVGPGTKDLFKIVSISGSAEGLQAHLSKQIDVRFSTANDAMQYVESGEFKLLGTTASAVNPDYPDIPTLKDLGYDVVFTNKQGFFAPKNISQEIMDILTDAIKQAAATDKFKEYCKKSFSDPIFKGGDWEEILKADDKLYAELVEQIKAETAKK